MFDHSERKVRNCTSVWANTSTIETPSFSVTSDASPYPIRRKTSTNRDERVSESEWHPPDDYQPIRGVSAYLLRMDTPAADSAEGKLLKMIHEWKSSRDVGMTSAMARSLIDRRLVPTGVYPNLLSLIISNEAEID